MVKAWPYVRFSSDQQTEGDSIRRQMAHHEAFAKAEGLTLERPILDLGVSAAAGKNLRRGELAKFIEAVKNGLVASGDYLLIEGFDRFSRAEANIALEALLTLINHGIVIATTRDKTIIRPGDGYLTYLKPLVELGSAHDENKRRADHGRNVWAEKRRNAAAKPLTRICPGWLRMREDGSGYEVVEGRADIVRRIFRETADGIGKDKIARRFNAERLPSFTGGERGWYSSYIGKILSNRAVLGEFQPCRKNVLTGGRQVPDGEPVGGYFPAVIDHTLFERATAARVGRQGKGGRRGQLLRNLFSGICYCISCDASMVLRSKGRRREARRPRSHWNSISAGDVLVCGQAIRGRGCMVRSHLHYPSFEKAILDNLDALLFDPSVTTRNNHVVEIEERLSATDVRIAKIKHSIEVLAAEFVGGATPTISNLIRAHDAEVSALERHREELNNKLISAKGTLPLAEHVEAVQRLRADAEQADDLEKRYLSRARIAEAIRKIVDFICVEPANRCWHVVAGGGFVQMLFEGGSVKYVDLEFGGKYLRILNGKVFGPFNGSEKMRDAQRGLALHDPERVRTVIERVQRSYTGSGRNKKPEASQ